MRAMSWILLLSLTVLVASCSSSPANPQEEAVLAPLRAEAQEKPQSAQAQYALATKCAELGRFDEAEKAFARAAALEPSSGEAQCGFAISYALRAQDTFDGYGRMGAARPHLRKCVELKPDLPEARFLLGASCLFVQDKDCAVEQYNILARSKEPHAKESAKMLYDLLDRYDKR